MIKTKVNAHLLLKTHKKIGVVNNSFTNHLLLLNRFSNYILAFMNFVHPIKENSEKESSEGVQGGLSKFKKSVYNINHININNFDINQIKKNNYYSIYNNYLKLFFNNSFKHIQQNVDFVLSQVRFPKIVYKYKNQLQIQNIALFKNIDFQKNNEVRESVFNRFLISVLKQKIIQSFNQSFQGNSAFFNKSLIFFNKSEQKLINNIINQLKIEDKHLNIRYDQSLVDVLNQISTEKIKKAEIKKYIKQVCNLVSKTIKNNMKDEKVFSPLQIKNFERFLSKTNATQDIENLFENLFCQVSDVCEKKDVKNLFENLLSKTLVHSDVIKIDKKRADNILLYLHNKYNKFANIREQKRDDYLRINLVNKIRNLVSQEFYDNFIDIYHQKGAEKLAKEAKLFVQTKIKEILEVELKNNFDFKTIDNIINQFVDSVVLEISQHTSFEHLKFDNNLLVVIKKQISKKIENDQWIQKFVDQNFNIQTQKIYKSEIYNFIKNNLDKYVVKNSKDSQLVQVMSQVVSKELQILTNKSNQEKFVASQISGLINNTKNINIYKIVNNHFSILNPNNNNYYLNNNQEKNDFFEKIDGISLVHNKYLLEIKPEHLTVQDGKNLVNNFVKKFEENTSKKEQNKIIYYKNFEFLKNTNFVKKFEENTSKKEQNKIIYHKNFEFLKSTNFVKKFEENTSKKEQNRIIYHKNFEFLKNTNLENKKIKMQNVFDGFEHLKMVHKKNSENQEKSVLDLQPNSRTIFDKNVVNYSFREIAQNNHKLSRQEEHNIFDSQISKKISYQKDNHEYENLIENVVKEKMEKIDKNTVGSMVSIANKVYDDIEKRLRAEQRRAGLL